MHTSTSIHLHGDTTATPDVSNRWVTIRDGGSDDHFVLLFPHSADATRALIAALTATLPA